MFRSLSLIVVLLVSSIPVTDCPAEAADVLRVGDGPFIPGGGFFIAREKGYFRKLDIAIKPNVT